MCSAIVDLQDWPTIGKSQPYLVPDEEAEASCGSSSFNYIADAQKGLHCGGRSATAGCCRLHFAVWDNKDCQGERPLSTSRNSRFLNPCPYRAISRLSRTQRFEFYRSDNHSDAGATTEAILGDSGRETRGISFEFFCPPASLRHDMRMGQCCALSTSYE